MAWYAPRIADGPPGGRSLGPTAKHRSPSPKERPALPGITTQRWLPSLPPPSPPPSPFIVCRQPDPSPQGVAVSHIARPMSSQNSLSIAHMQTHPRTHHHPRERVQPLTLISSFLFFFFLLLIWVSLHVGRYSVILFRLPGCRPPPGRPTHARRAAWRG